MALVQRIMAAVTGNTEAAAQPTQTAPIAGEEGKMGKNNAGGFSFVMDPLKQLQRFLVLGADGNTYYVSAQDMARENAGAVIRMLDSGLGPQVVATIVEFSVDGRAPKQDSTLFSLALCVSEGDEETKRAALLAVNKVCRIPTHLFQFIAYLRALGVGWGRATKRCIAQWYTQFDGSQGKSARKLAEHVTKYQQRQGWSHKDVLRLSHSKPSNNALDLVFVYVTKGFEAAQAKLAANGTGDDVGVTDVVGYLSAVEKAKALSDPAEDGGAMVELIRQHRLVREHVPTPLLSSTEVWSALLESMPTTAMIRNLGKMSTFPELHEQLQSASARLLQESTLRAARIHPFNVLVAFETYRRGHGDKGKLTWPVLEKVKDNLEKAFYLSFKTCEPTQQRYLFGLDVSGSMCCPVNGSANITCRIGCAALAMCAVRMEPWAKTMAFTNEFVEFPLSPTDKLEAVVSRMNGMRFGATDCALPIQYAMQKNLAVDVFVVITDSETYAPKMHPMQALRQYRENTGIPAKLIVIGMSATKFSIADPNDAGCLDIAGFDSAAPEIMANFARGQI